MYELPSEYGVPWKQLPKIVKDDVYAHLSVLARTSRDAATTEKARPGRAKRDPAIRPDEGQQRAAAASSETKEKGKVKQKRPDCDDKSEEDDIDGEERVRRWRARE